MIRQPQNWLVLLSGLLLLTAGCGRMNTFSEVKPDGSLVRTLTFKGGDANAKPSGPGASEGPNPMAMMGGGPSLPIEAIAVIPKGNGWTVTRTKKESEVTITATRTVPPGQTITDDLGLRMEPDETFMRGTTEPAPKPAAKPTPKPTPKPGAKPGATPKPKPSGGSKPGELHLAAYTAPVAQAPPAPKLMLSNTVTVREIEPGKLEYKEVLHWNGTRPKDFEQADPEMVADLRKALPASLANDPGVPKVAVAAQKEIFALLMGPGDMLLPLMLFHQELAEYKLMGRIGGALDRALTAEFGNRITDAERKVVVDKLMQDAMTSVTDKTKKPPSGDNDPTNGMGNSMPVAMLFRVKMPGKVISTNGQWNADTGEVIWPMYSLAPAIGDVTLTAICEKP